MTTAYARAVSLSFGKALRPALMAAASAAVLVSLASPGNAASCVTTADSDVCVINLGNIADLHDGNANTTGAGDKLQFNDNANPLTVQGKQFVTGDGSASLNFVDFELAEIINNTTLTITSTTGDAAPAGITAWSIEAGSTLNVSGTGGNALGDAAAVTVAGTFNVNTSETIGSLLGAGSVVVANGQVLATGGGATAFTGVISGAGGLAKVGGSTLTLDNVNTYTGATTVATGILELKNANAIASSSGVTIGLGSGLRGASTLGNTPYNINGPVTVNGLMSGNAVINGNVANNNVMQPGQSPGTMTINGTYTAGTAAFFDMEVDLDLALPGPGTPGTTHDFININGVNGNVIGPNKTFVALTPLNTPDVGTATTGNGIQLIRVQGTTTADAFQQLNALNAGAYQYLLTYVADYAGTDDGYFLQSAIRDEMVAHPALLSAGQAMIRHCFRDDQRIPDSPKGATYGRGWVGYHQGNTSFGADTGIEMDQDYNCTTGGMDWRMGYGWFGGISGGLGKTNADLDTAAGGGTLDGSARAIEAYASFTSSSLFVNLSAGYADMDWTYRGALLGDTTATTSGFIGSAQAGLALSVAPFAVKLIGGVSYDDTSCGDSCFGFDVTEDTGLIEAKGTVRIDGVTWGGAIRPWAAVSYSDVLSDGINTVSLGAVSVSADTNDQLLSIDAGLQTYLDENLALFADGGYHESLGKDITGYKGGVGLKLYW